MKKHPTLSFTFCDILLIPEGEMFYSLTLLHREVRGQSSTGDRGDSVSLVKDTWAGARCLREEWVKDRLPTLNDTPLLPHVHTKVLFSLTISFQSNLTATLLCL